MFFPMDVILKKLESKKLKYTLEDNIVEEDKEEAGIFKKITRTFNENHKLEDIIKGLYKEDHFVVHYPEELDEENAKAEYFRLLDKFSDKNKRAKKRNTVLAFFTLPLYYFAYTENPAFIVALPPLNFFIHSRRNSNKTVVENVEEAKETSEFKPLSHLEEPKRMELYIKEKDGEYSLDSNYKLFKARLEDKIKKDWLKKVVHVCGGNLDDNELIIRKFPKRSLAVYYPSSLDENAAEKNYNDLLDFYYAKHKKKLIRNSVYLAFSALLTPIPGPNLLADYIMYCMYLNYKIMRKSKQGKAATFYKNGAK